jgi:hypothetical protein
LTTLSACLEALFLFTFKDNVFFVIISVYGSRELSVFDVFK